MATLPLSDIININISVGPVNAIRARFNTALIIGTSKVINVKDRMKTYRNLGDMRPDGWKGTEPEYLAAQLYFSQEPRPSKVAIGVWDKDNLEKPESAVEAMTACREVNGEWYVGYICDVNKEEITQVAKYIEGATPKSIYSYTTSDSAVLEGAEDNIAKVLKETGVKRTIGQYSTDDHSVMGIIGYAMGANTQTANSAYTLKFKKEVGVKTESLSNSQLEKIKSNNCNAYVNRGVNFNIFEDGVMADGTPFDEVLNFDMLQNNLQSALINAFQINPKIPQTQDGMDTLLNYLVPELEKAKTNGIIAPGIWNLPGILDVKTGDPLPLGYMIMSDNIDEQSQVDREERKAPQIYILLKLSGSIESVVIGAYVNR